MTAKPPVPSTEATLLTLAEDIRRDCDLPDHDGSEHDPVLESLNDAYNAGYNARDAEHIGARLNIEISGALLRSSTVLPDEIDEDPPSDEDFARGYETRDSEVEREVDFFENRVARLEAEVAELRSEVAEWERSYRTREQEIADLLAVKKLHPEIVDVTCARCNGEGHVIPPSKTTAGLECSACYGSGTVPSVNRPVAPLEPDSTFIAGRRDISRPGGAIRATKILLTEEGKRALSLDANDERIVDDLMGKRAATLEKRPMPRRAPELTERALRAFRDVYFSVPSGEPLKPWREGVHAVLDLVLGKKPSDG